MASTAHCVISGSSGGVKVYQNASYTNIGRGRGGKCLFSKTAMNIISSYRYMHFMLPPTLSVAYSNELCNEFYRNNVIAIATNHLRDPSITH